MEVVEMLQKNGKALLVLFVSILLCTFLGCDGFYPESSEKAVVTSDLNSSFIDIAENEGLYKKGAYMAIAWPFQNESTSDWSGWQGQKTSGALGWYCGVNRYTHDGAEFYGRDLNRTDGTWEDYGREISAGIEGVVIQAKTNGGYGQDIVLYDKKRHVAVRYSHLSEMYVSKGDYVKMRQLIGAVGNSGTGTPHLHLVGFENINDNNGNPIIPNLCDSDFFSLILYFYC